MNNLAKCEILVNMNNLFQRYNKLIISMLMRTQITLVFSQCLSNVIWVLIKLKLSVSSVLEVFQPPLCDLFQIFRILTWRGHESSHVGWTTHWRSGVSTETVSRTQSVSPTPTTKPRLTNPSQLTPRTTRTSPHGTSTGTTLTVCAGKANLSFPRYATKTHLK